MKKRIQKKIIRLKQLLKMQEELERRLTKEKGDVLTGANISNEYVGQPPPPKEQEPNEESPKKRFSWTELLIFGKRWWSLRMMRNWQNISGASGVLRVGKDASPVLTPAKS